MPGLEKIIIGRWEEDTCLYCGMVIYEGEVAYYDEESDSIFCSKECFSDFINFEKIEKSMSGE
jgi:hypothetical protein